MRRFERVRLSPGNPDVARAIVALNDRIAATLDEITNKAQLDSYFLDRETGSAITGLDLVAGRENHVEHGLGRAVAGWHLADIRGPAFVWRVADSEADLTKYLPLACSQDVTVALVVF